MRRSLAVLGAELAVCTLSVPARAAPADPPAEAARQGDPLDAPVTEEPPTQARRARGESSLGAHWLFAQGKAMPGITLRGGRGLWWFVFEASLIWLTEPDPDQRFHFLGNQLGGFFMVRPFTSKYFELEAGLGADVYPLWNIHEDEWQLGFAARAAGRFRVSSKLAVFGTARAYPLSTPGLELGVRRDGTRSLPLLFGSGVEWRFQ